MRFTNKPENRAQVLINNGYKPVDETSKVEFTKLEMPMTKEEYRHFTESLVIIKQKANIDIAHTVEYQGDNFIVEILDEINLKDLDDILLGTDE